jgi:hypothetical protein
MQSRKIVTCLRRSGFAQAGAERVEVFEGHTRCGMDKNTESLYAHEITVMRNELMHNSGFIIKQLT